VHPDAQRLVHLGLERPRRGLLAVFEQIVDQTVARRRKEAEGQFELFAMVEEPSAAEELRIPLLANGWSDVLSDASLRSDQVHANAEGYRRFTERLTAALREHGWLA